MSLREQVIADLREWIDSGEGDCDFLKFKAPAFADAILALPQIAEALETHAMVTAMEGWGEKNG